MSSRQRQSQQSTQSRETRASRNPAESAPPEEQRSGMWGWLQNTGDWIADKYNDVSTGVSDWAGGVRDSANEIWDIVESSNFEAKDGIWSLDTDLDEIQDVIAMEGISLDREASDNQVRMEIDRNSGTLTLKCSNLAINALAFDGFTVQSVSLSDVNIQVENASMDAGFLGTLSAKKGGSDNAPQNVRLHAGSITGRGITVQDASINNGQAITLEELRLENFQLNANGSKDLFEDAPNQASFSVANAILRGIKTTQNGTEVGGNLTMANASGSMDSNAGTGSMNIEDLHASQVVAGSNMIENSQFKGLNANINPNASGSGHIANVSANQAAVRGIDTSMVDATGFAGSGISARFDTSSQQLDASVKAMRAHNLSTDGLDTNATIGGATVNDLLLSSDLDDNRHSGSVGSMAANNIQHGGSTISSASINGLAASSTNSGQAASLQQGSLAGISAYGHNADLLTIGGASVSNVNGAQNLNLNNGSVRGYSSEYGTVDNAGISGINLAHSEGNASGSIENASANNVNAMGVAASRVSIDNTSLRHTPKGSSLNIGEISGRDINGHGAQADALSIKGASAHGNRDFTQSGFMIDNVSGTNLQHNVGSIDDLSLNEIRGSRNNNVYDASLGSVSAKNADITDLVSAQSISGSNASVQATIGDDVSYQAGLDSLSARNIKGATFGTQIGEANISGAQVSGVNTTKMNASLASGEVNDFALQGGTIENAHIKDVGGHFDHGRGGVELGEVAFTNAQYQDMLKVNGGLATNIRANGTAEKQHGSMDSANVHGISVIQPQSVSHIEEASLQGGHFTHNGEGKGNIGVNRVGAQNIQVDVADMDKTQSVSGSTSDPIANVDFDELLSTGARRLDNAQVQAQVGLRPGTLGSGMASVGIENGTHLNANINIANNQIQDGSRIEANKALDTALFTSVKGGYVKNGELNADVRGWFDMGISENINDSVGLDGKKLHSIGDYASAVAKMPASEGNSMDNPVDLSTLRAKGNASLSNGTVSAGDASLTLAGASNGSNQMNFEATSNQIAMRFAQLLASSFQLNTSMGKGETGEIAIDNGSFTVNPQQGTARGLVDAVSVSDINIGNE